MTGQQLKNSILQLAIQGKLVPQDPNDEPASKLLERIRKEKKKLFNDGKLKKKDIEPSIINEEVLPFEAPQGWEWATLKDISLDSADGPFGSNLKKEHYTDKKEVRIIQLSNIGEDGWKDANVRYTTFAHLPNIARSEAFAGDIIIAKMMPAGRAIICPEGDAKYVLSSDAVRFGFSDCLLRKYLYYAINSRIFLDQVYSEVQGITRVRTSLNKLRTYCLPIPPINEQYRIVEIIEEILPLIEQYGKSQEKLEDLNKSLPDALKKSILQEAIMGKLVPQDPTEEPASALLARIRSEKEKLVKKGILKKKDLTTNPITDEEIPFEIPESWEWVRLGQITQFSGGYAFKSHEYVDKANGIRILRISDFNENGIINKSPVYSSKLKKEDSCLLNEGDIIMCMTGGTVGKSYHVKELNEPMYINQRVASIKVNKAVSDNYIYINIIAPFVQNIILDSKNSTNDNISAELIKNFLIPLPPLSEQYRIVAKIEELFKIIK